MSDTMPTRGTADSILERLPSDRPTPQQFAWQDLELGVFVHFGLYAVTGRFTAITWIPEGANPLYCSSLEPVDPGLFNPVEFDAQQWVSTAQAGGVELGENDHFRDHRSNPPFHFPDVLLVVTRSRISMSR